MEYSVYDNPLQATATKTDLLKLIVTLKNNKKYKLSRFFNLINIFIPIFIEKEAQKESNGIKPLSIALSKSSELTVVQDP